MAQKQIRSLSEPDVNRLYGFEKNLCASSNRGMEIINAKRLLDGIDVVIKTRVKSVSFKDRQEHLMWREAHEYLLNMPPCDGLCKVLDVIETPTVYYIVMEKCSGRNIFDQMKCGAILTEDVREITQQLLEALHVLHSTGRIHKDMKLKNVMVDINKKIGVSVKIVDYDTVVPYGPSAPKHRDVLGTDGYIAPEAYSGDYSPASDIYALGVMVYRMLTGRCPTNMDIFDDKPGENVVGHPAMQRIKQRLMQQRIHFLVAPLDRLPDVSTLLQSMLKAEPTDRPSANQALNQKWFATRHGIGNLRNVLSSMSISDTKRSVAGSAVSTADTLPDLDCDDDSDDEDCLSEVDSDDEYNRVSWATGDAAFRRFGVA